MATLRKKKTKDGFVWFVDFHFEGKRYRKSTRTNDKKLAELFRKDIEVRIAKGEFGFQEAKKNQTDLEGFMKRYLEFSIATKAENTYLLDKQALGVLKRFLGNILLKNITYSRLEDYKVKRSGEVKPASVNIEIRHLKAAFEMARKWGYIKENPFREVKQIRIKGTNLPKFIPKDDIKALLSVIQEGDFKKLIQFYLYTGCRRNEALGLSWSRINFDTGKIHLHETKSGNDRIVPMNSNLRKLLLEMDRATDKPFNFLPDFVTKKFKKYLKLSGIRDWQAFTVHSLRHTFASHLVMEGTDLYTVSKLLGHSSVAVTQMYAHLAPDYLKVSIERLRF